MSNFNHLTNDLINFIDDLRVAGYNIGLEQFITVQNLIMALTAQGRLPAKLADLQTFLAPVLCHSPKEQEDFAQHFEKWVRRFETIIEVKSQPSSLETELKSISRGMTFWKWTWRIVFVLVLTLIPMELFKLDKDISELQSPQTTKSIDKTTPSASTEVKPPVSPELLVPPTLPPQTTLSQNIWELKWSIGLTLSLPLFLFLTWWLWWQYQVRRFLARKTVSTQPDLQQFLVQGHKHQLFSSVPLQRVAHGLRKHFTLPTSHLDVKTTLAKTIQAGGWFTPVMGTVQTSPEYLVLIDRTTFRDHQAEFINTLVKRLEAEEVFITRYYFDADPRRCYPEQPQLPPLTLPELAGRYPQHRLLIFTDGQGFIHPITGELAGWVTQLSDWSQRTLFTLEALQQWGYREKLLEDEAGFLVLPANEAGLTVLVEYINEQRKSDLVSSSEAPFPEMLIDRPRRYLERHTPEAETVTELLAQVRQFLGKTGYDWFSACAVYPELRWQLTLYLGEALQVLNEERLAKLARLPWFRYGYMPNWLREKLVKDLSLAQERQIREALQVLLLTAVEGGKGEFRLEVAREPQKSLLNLAKRLLPILSKKVDKRSALRDYVFLTFLANPLSVRVPKVMYGIWGQGRELVPSVRVISLFIILVLVIVSVPIVNWLPISPDIDLGTKFNKQPANDKASGPLPPPVLPPPLPPKLFIAVIGPGFGKVISSPNLISCESMDCHDDPKEPRVPKCKPEKCMASVKSGTIVTLMPLANPGSHFSSWGNDHDCMDGQVTMMVNKLCVAYFRPNDR